MKDKMTTQSWIVKVGCDPRGEPFSGREFSGENIYGPMTGQEALQFKQRVETEWIQRTGDEFIYGVPYVKVEPLWNDATPEKAARNWFSPLDEAV